MTQSHTTKLAKALLVFSTLLIFAGCHLRHRADHFGGPHPHGGEDHFRGGDHHMMMPPMWRDRHHNNRDGSHSHSMSLPFPEEPQDDMMMPPMPVKEDGPSASIPETDMIMNKDENDKRRRHHHRRGPKGPMMGEGEDMEMMDEKEGPRMPMKEGPMRRDDVRPLEFHGKKHHGMMFSRRGPHREGPARRHHIEMHIVSGLLTLTGIVGLIAGARESRCLATVMLVLLVLTCVSGIVTAMDVRHHAIRYCEEKPHCGRNDRMRMMMKDDKEMMKPPMKPMPVDMPPMKEEPVIVEEVVEIDVVEMKNEKKPQDMEVEESRAAQALEHHGRWHKGGRRHHDGKKEGECMHHVNFFTGMFLVHIVFGSMIGFILAAKMRKSIIIESYTAVPASDAVDGEPVVCCVADEIPVKEAA